MTKVVLMAILFLITLASAEARSRHSASQSNSETTPSAAVPPETTKPDADQQNKAADKRLDAKMKGICRGC
jgi:hypothetical protein